VDSLKLKTILCQDNINGVVCPSVRLEYGIVKTYPRLTLKWQLQESRTASTSLCSQAWLGH
jgi:hypothetical protein